MPPEGNPFTMIPAATNGPAGPKAIKAPTAAPAPNTTVSPRAILSLTISKPYLKSTTLI